MDIQVTALGAVIGLIISIVLIFLKTPPVYSLLIGAIAGGLLGGATLAQTIELMIEGAQGMTTTILRILGAGILAGVLIKSGAAESIATTIMRKIGETRSLLALAVATMLLTAVGVFVDIAVITVAPIALIVANRTSTSKTSILLAMVGGGKAGNLMSPNPNTIAVAEAFGAPLTSVMLAGVIPGILSLFVTFFIAKKLVKSGSTVNNSEVESDDENKELPSFGKSLSGPIVAVILLVLRPLFNIEIDPMIALPIGGLIGSIITGQVKDITEQATYGLSKMSNVAILLVGTGTVAGIITNSTLGDALINGISSLGLPVYLLAPISGIAMGAATASTTSGSVVASSVFSDVLLDSGVGALGGAAMMHAGATVIDHLPHGSFFHATGGSVFMGFQERLKLIPYETIVGLTLTIISTIIFGLIL